MLTNGIVRFEQSGPVCFSGTQNPFKNGSTCKVKEKILQGLSPIQKKDENDIGRVAFPESVSFQL